MNILVEKIKKIDRPISVSFFTNSVMSIFDETHETLSFYFKISKCPRINQKKRFPRRYYGICTSLINQCIEISVWDNMHPIGIIKVYPTKDPEPDSPKSVSEALDIILDGYRDNKEQE